MKHVKIIFTAIVLLAVSGITSAQTKVAHINSTKLMEDLPEVKDVQEKLKQYTDAYNRRIQRLEKDIIEIQTILRDSSDLLPQPQVEYLTETYQEKYQEYQRVQQEFQEKYIAKQQELLDPIVKKLKEIIIEVAKEKGFDYVLDSTEGSNFIYGNPSYDLLEAVKKRLAEIAAAEAQTPETGTGN